ncbi:MAG: hypothetical protein ACRERC_11530, partial [Candidatus Binatia bacterium]
MRGALLAILLLAVPAAAPGETWQLVGNEYPAVEWDYADGRFTRDGNAAHYIREPGDDHLDIRFGWREPPAQVASDTSYELEVTADVIAGWDCRPFFLGARVFLTQMPCAFCVDSREVGAGICDEHNEGLRTFSIAAGNFGQTEARLHVQATDGSLFGATIVTYVYARAVAGTPTATATRTPTQLASATRTPTQLVSATHTPTRPADDDIACGETVGGALSDADPDLFNDGTFADVYFFTLARTTAVLFSLSAEDFEPFVWVGDPSDPSEYVVVFQGRSPQAETLPAGRYVVVANNFTPIAPGSYPYTLQLDCDGEPTATHTATRTPSRSATATAMATRPAAPTATASP